MGGGHTHAQPGAYDDRDAVKAVVVSAVALGAAAVVVANLGVSEYKIRVGRGLKSPALEADGVHSRIDALVSAGAFLGVLASWRGLQLADPIAGLLITAMILYILAGTIRQLFY